jgi:hypothetical protein
MHYSFLCLPLSTQVAKHTQPKKGGVKRTLSFDSIMSQTPSGPASPGPLFLVREHGES